MSGAPSFVTLVTSVPPNVYPAARIWLRKNLIISGSSVFLAIDLSLSASRLPVNNLSLTSSPDKILR